MSDAPITFIDAETLETWLKAGDAALFDVREDNEFAVERIPGSTLVPLSRFDPSAITAEDGKKIVFHCRSGVRCGQASALLREAGDGRPLHRLEGGINAWKSAGMPVEPGA